MINYPHVSGATANNGIQRIDGVLFSITGSPEWLLINLDSSVSVRNHVVRSCVGSLQNTRINPFKTRVSSHAESLNSGMSFLYN